MVVHDPKILSNGRVKIALAQIIETMETCARGLERLPASPVGAETADLRLRQLGKDIFDFVGLLNDITGYHNQLDSQRTAQKFSENTEQIKVNFREAILAYDQAFPGRLEGIL